MISNIRKVAMTVVAGAALAACQAADGTSQAPDTALVASLMSGLGAIDPQAKPIEYKPRAPLAMPANSTALPEPETQVAGSQSEAWPKNAGNKELARVQAIYADTSGTRGKLLSPEQMRGIDIGSTNERNRALEAREQDLMSGERMTSEEMRSQHNSVADLSSPKNNVASADKLQRKYLTDPPAIYSVPSSDAPMPNVVEEEEKVRLTEREESAPLDMRCLEETGGACVRGR